MDMAGMSSSLNGEFVTTVPCTLDAASKYTHTTCLVLELSCHGDMFFLDVATSRTLA
jgi:lantibiotic modifying enzyme